METPVKDRLKKKANKRNGSEASASEPNIFDMLAQVNEILKKNPDMVNKVNRCVSSIIDNPDIMSKISSEIKDSVVKELGKDETLEDPSSEDQAQTLESNSETLSLEAESNDSKQ